VKKGLKIVLTIVGVFLLLLAVLAGVTQTQYFRDRLRAAVLSNLDSLLIADVYIGPLRGNLVSGFSIDSVALAVDGTPVISAERIDLRYSLWEIPGKTFAVNTLTLVRPTVRLIKGRDGAWNLSRIARPAPPDTTPASPFTWAIDVRRFELRKGTLIVTDSTQNGELSAAGGRWQRLHNFTASDINMVLGAHIAKAEKRIDLQGLSLDCNAPAFHLKRLAGVFTITAQESRVQNLVITTDRTDLSLSASMGKFDLLGGLSLEKLRHCPVTLSLWANPINLNELGELLPPVDFLNGPTFLMLDADGEFGDLGIQRLDLVTGGTRLSLKGKISNLHAPRALTMDVKISDGKVQPHDLLELMPSFDLPDYSALGTSAISLDFVGKPLDFKTRFVLETQSGSVKGDVSLGIGGPKTLKYNGEITVANLNLAGVLDDDVFASNMNGTVRAEGEGMDLEGLASSVTAQFGPSEFRGLPLLAPNVQVTANNRQVHGTGEISLGDMRSSFTVDLDTQVPEVPRFDVSANLRSLNLAPLLRDQKFDSDLTLRMEGHGTGLNWKTLDGELLLDFSSSRYRDYRISKGDMHLLLQQHDPAHKQLSLQSNIADFSLTGAFDLEYLARLISYEATSLRGAIGRRFASIDSSLATGVDQKKLAVAGKRLALLPTRLDAEYSLQIKDLEPISVVAGNRTFNGAGVLKGSITGDYQGLDVHGRLDVEDFYYGNVESGVLLQNSTVGFDVTSLRPDHVLENLDMQLAIDADKMHINNLMLDTLRLQLAYAQDRATYALRSSADGEMRLAARGDAVVTQEGFATTLDEFRWAYKDFMWQADSGAIVQVSQKGLQVAGLVMRRDTSSVAVHGSLGTGGTMDFAIVTHRFNLGDLKYVMKQGTEAQRRQAFVGAADFSVKASGTFEQPEYTASLQAENIAFRGIPFGDLQGDFAYRNGQLGASIQGGSRRTNAGSPDLVISGTIPISLALKGVDERGSERPMNLRIRSVGVQISILDPLLPTFNELSGIMRCDVTVGGTLSNPDYHGDISIADGAFLFEPNNIHYTMNAAFQAEGERITVTNATIKNIPADNRGGREGVMQLSGDFLLRDLVPSDFNLAAQGQLLVVTETSRLSSLSLYGNLFVEIGKAGLHFTGGLDQSLLKGTVVISNSSLTFPPTQTSVKEEELMATVPVVFVDDTAHPAPPDKRSSLVHYFNGGNGKREETPEDTAETRSFLDGVRYDLDIETAGGNTQIRMVFNSTTNEELVANLEGKVRVTGDGKQWFGDLDVIRAYYNFFKRFDAEGQIRFTGDLMNPELNITAKYQGTRALGDSLDENVVVTFKITGSRLEPKIDISMTIAGEDYYSYANSGRGPTSRDVQTDAIQFIVYGSFPLTSAQKANARADIGTTVGSSLATGATSLVTGALSEFLRNQTGFINSVELSYGGGGTLKESADIRLSGMAWHGYWRYGGKILDDPLNSANFSIQYSLGTIFAEPALRNLMIELERKVENNSIGQANDLKRVDSARLFYRFSF
jgi:hypothetical protein